MIIGWFRAGFPGRKGMEFREYYLDEIAPATDSKTIKNNYHYLI